MSTDSFDYSLEFNKSSVLSLVDVELNNSLNVQGPLLLRGVEWIFTWLDKQITYGVTILYNTFIFEITTSDLLNILYTSCSGPLIVAWYTVALDIISNIYHLQFPFLDNWYSYITRISSNIIFTLEHPEMHYYYASSQAADSYFYSSLLDFALEHDYLVEFLSSFVLIFFDLLLKLSLCCALIFYLISLYTNNSTSNAIDIELLINSLTIESEEEIASIEDTVILLIIILFIFGWFFLYTYINIITLLGDVIVIFMFIPLLLYILLLIPVFLLWDYGMHFLTYLRGAGSTSSLIMEFIYDCIAFLAFFIRLSVQNVRLLLITLTFFSLYEYILFFVNANWFYVNFEQLNKLIADSQGMYTSYYYFLYAITKIIYWVYELLHTFFVTIAQFVAFFAMVFWLFLFLYTMFVVEEFEKYLEQKRNKYK